jgi:hypothetical protein
MSDLTALEKRKLEQFLGTGNGYVLDFSNRSFEEFVRDSMGREIFDHRYDYGSGSKANRLRAFWQKEDNAIVAKLLGDLLGSLHLTSPSGTRRRQAARPIMARPRGFKAGQEINRSRPIRRPSRRFRSSV